MPTLDLTEVLDDLLVAQLEEKLHLPECEAEHISPRQPRCSIEVTSLASHSCDGFSAKVCQNMADYVEVQRATAGHFCPVCLRPCDECWRVTPIN